MKTVLECLESGTGYLQKHEITSPRRNINAFWSLTQARMIITEWKHQHNHYRPLSALDYQAPAIHAAHCTYGK